MGKDILFVSGGEYGDVYGASLAESLKDVLPSAAVRCVGGGGKGGPDINGELEGGRAGCLVLSDEPCLNLHSMRKAKDRGIPVICYAAHHDGPPKARQLRKLAGLVDMALAVFPFEVPVYREAGIEAEFVGHPLVDVMEGVCAVGKKEARIALGYDRNDAPITLIPGGGSDEAGRLLRLMVEGAAEASEVSMLKGKVVVPDAERYDKGLLEELIKMSPRRVRVFEGQRHLALRASDAAVVAAGTATVEAALAGARPVIIRKAPALSHFLSNPRGGSVLYGFPNIVLGRQLCPELVQRKVTPANITIEVVGLLEGATKEEFDRGLAEVGERLGRPGTVRRAAEAICRVMGGQR